MKWMSVFVAMRAIVGGIISSKKILRQRKINLRQIQRNRYVGSDDEEKIIIRKRPVSVTLNGRYILDVEISKDEIAKMFKKAFMNE